MVDSISGSPNQKFPGVLYIININMFFRFPFQHLHLPRDASVPKPLSVSWYNLTPHEAPFLLLIYQDTHALGLILQPVH